MENIFSKMLFNSMDTTMVTSMLHTTTLSKAKSVFKPMLQSSISHVLISFVLGYYATTKIVQLLHAMLADDSDDNDNCDVIGGKVASDRSKNNNANNPTGNEVAVSKAQRHLQQTTAQLQLNAQQLMAYDGFNAQRPIYTALNGKIYDLSTARALFQPSGPYSLLAGCNANKVLAMACGYMNVSSDDFIQRWEQCLTSDFNVIGHLISDDEEEKEVELCANLEMGKVKSDLNDTTVALADVQL